MEIKNIYITPFHNLKPVAMTIIAYIKNISLNLEDVYNILKNNETFKIRFKEKFSFSSNIINISYRTDLQNINIKISTDNIHYTGLKSVENARELSNRIMEMLNYKNDEYCLDIKKVMINYNFHIGFCINKIEFVKFMNEAPFQISFDNTFNQHIKVYHYYHNSEGKRVRETLIVRWKGSVTISSSEESQMEKSYYLFINRINKFYNEISILNQPIFVSYNPNIDEKEEIDNKYLETKISNLKTILENNDKKLLNNSKLLNDKLKGKNVKININLS